MSASYGATKPYWEMGTEELAAATREFDAESHPRDFRPLGVEKSETWKRLQSGTTRFRSVEDVRALRERIVEAGVKLASSLKAFSKRDPVEILKGFKLLPVGFDPYDARREMNLIEQINQSATLLVACAAVESLIRKHPSDEGYAVSRPTSKGYDVWAIDVSVAAEVFAATSPGSNRKLAKDLTAVLKNKEPFALDPPRHRYIFFASQSLKGIPARLGAPEQDEIFGCVWRLIEHGRSSVTIVRLPEDSVFC